MNRNNSRDANSLWEQVPPELGGEMVGLPQRFRKAIAAKRTPDKVFCTVDIGEMAGRNIDGFNSIP